MNVSTPKAAQAALQPRTVTSTPEEAKLYRGVGRCFLLGDRQPIMDPWSEKASMRIQRGRGSWTASGVHVAFAQPVRLLRKTEDEMKSTMDSIDEDLTGY